MADKVTIHEATTPECSPLIIGIETTGLTAQDSINLQNPLVGGVILFARNYESPEQLIQLCKTIKAIRSPELLICVDQEGGRVQRFKDGFTRLPPLSVYGEMAASDLQRACDYSYRHGRVMAAELRAHGVDLSFAPVLDVQSASTVIGDRAFSSDIDSIAQLGKAMIAGMRDAGMMTTAKHFPGHGSVLADTHTELVIDQRALDAIEHYDLQPFRELIPELQGVMMAHVCYPCLSASPAGYAPEWVKDVLRNQLSFRKAILSDDLDMRGGAAIGSLYERLHASFNAGCNLALVCNADSATGLLQDLSDYTIDIQSGIDWLRPTGNALSMSEMSSVSEWRQWQVSMQELADSSAG